MLTGGQPSRYVPVGGPSTLRIVIESGMAEFNSSEDREGLAMFVEVAEIAEDAVLEALEMLRVFSRR